MSMTKPYREIHEVQTKARLTEAEDDAFMASLRKIGGKKAVRMRESIEIGVELLELRMSRDPEVLRKVASIMALIAQAKEVAERD